MSDTSAVPLGQVRTAAASAARAARARGRRAARAARRSRSPTPRRASRTRSSAVNPGIVFSSFTSTSPSRRTNMSTRAMPSQSVTTKARSASSRQRSSCSGDTRAGIDEVHLALDVLRLVVVPLVLRDHDLAGTEATGSRLPRTPTSTSIPSTNSSTSTFSSCRNASSTAAASSRVVVRLRDSDRRAEPGRLHEHRVGERRSEARSPVRSVMFRATGMPLSRSTDLKRSLSIASAEAFTPAPT